MYFKKSQPLRMPVNARDLRSGALRVPPQKDLTSKLSSLLQAGVVCEVRGTRCVLIVVDQINLICSRCPGSPSLI